MTGKPSPSCGLQLKGHSKAPPLGPEVGTCFRVSALEAHVWPAPSPGQILSSPGTASRTPGCWRQVYGRGGENSQATRRKRGDRLSLRMTTTTLSSPPLCSKPLSFSRLLVQLPQLLSLTPCSL